MMALRSTGGFIFFGVTLMRSFVFFMGHQAVFFIFALSIKF
jgi:hypothetical protein